MTTAADQSQSALLSPAGYRRRRTRGGLLATLAVVMGICIGLSACSLVGGNTVNQLQTNLANQRKVATKLVKDYPNPELESIRFTQDGSVSGGGQWSATAVVTVAGKEYEEILGTFVSLGDGLPTIAPGATPGPVTVIYSDGSSEVLK
jgi:hypothetical protein